MNKEELLKKIKALAEQGVGGEKENAQRTLKKLMEKYGITDDDLDDEKVQFFDIKMPKFYNSSALASQVMYSIVGVPTADNRKGLYRRGKSFSIKCTTAEFLEFQAKFKFYCHYFKEELKIFYQAFVQANRIFPDKKNEEESTIERDLTTADRKALFLAANLEKHEFRKQIEGGVR